MPETNGAANILTHLDQTVMIQVAFIAIFALLLILLLQRVLGWLGEKLPGRYRLYTLASIPVLRLLIIIIAMAMIISRIIEPSFENLVAILGAIGLALGFAFKDYASSLIAGVVTLYEMPYRVGDWIEIDGVYGEVQSINMRALEIVTPDDTVVVIPHLKLWDRLILNSNNGTRDLQCVADFYLAPAHDGIKVRHSLYDMAVTSPFVNVLRPVRIVARERPWGTHYRIRAYPVKPKEQFAFITDLTLRGKTVLNELGVNFAAAAYAPENI